MNVDDDEVGFFLREGVYKGWCILDICLFYLCIWFMVLFIL